jgi:transposase, IS5 family
VDDLTELLATTPPDCRAGPAAPRRHHPGRRDRRVSLHDPDARPIAKGRLGKPVEFGYKAQVLDNDDGSSSTTDCTRATRPTRPSSPRREAHHGPHRRSGTVTADRGYGEASVDDALQALGVRHVVIPRKGKPGKVRQATELRRAFRKTIKWRTGCEGRISSLKRGYGWDRTRLDGTDGARIWTGQAVLAHNLVKIGALAG